MQRVNEWPERLFDFLEQAESTEFSETYYCATFAADAVVVMTDFDPMEPYRGMTYEKASSAVRDDHGSLLKYLRSLFGESVPVSFARRGDVMLRGQGKALGICAGPLTAFLSDEGVAYEETINCRGAFHV